MPTKAVSLNVDKSGSFAALTMRISQGDESSTSIVATILDGAQPFDLTGKSVRFKCELPGGKVFVDEGVTVSNAEKGMVTFTLPAEHTTPRFAYIMSVPEGTTLIECGWYFKKVSNPSLPDVRSTSGNNVVQTGNTVYTAMTFNKVQPKYCGKKFSTKAFVKYTTADGTTVEAVEADYDAFTPAEIADAVLAHPMATQADKDYAAAIKAAVPQEGAA